MNWCGSVLLSVDLVIERLDELISELDIPGLVSFSIGPHTLHTKMQKIQLSSIHTTTFFHNCNDNFNSFYMSYDLPADFF